jgi:phasin family protein
LQHNCQEAIVAEVPAPKKPVTKGTKPDGAPPVKPVATAPVVAKQIVAERPLAKPAVAIPVIVKAVPALVRKNAPTTAKAPVTAAQDKIGAPAAVLPKAELPQIKAVKIEEPKVEAVSIAPIKVETPKLETVEPKPETEKRAATPVMAAVSMKGITMNDTIKTATEDMQQRATVMFGDMNTRAKDAMSKSTKAIEDLVEFSKGNVEAMVASGRVAAKGAEEFAKYSAEYGRSAVEKANATAKQFAAVKSPTEFFQLQGDVAKQALDALVAEGSKFTESYLKLIGEISQPISNRLAVAAEKVKTTIAA